MHRITHYLLFLLLSWLLSTQAALAATQPTATFSQLPPPILKKLQQALYASGFRADLPASATITLPEKDTGLYSVQVGIYLFDISADGRVSMQGNALEQVAEMQQADTGDYRDAAQIHAQIIRETLEALDEERLIVFAPEDEVKYTITIFTDISCPYSVELHREIDILNDAGVKIRYLGYPRMGETSLGYQKMRHVWCNEDRQQAFHRAINNRRFHLAQCSSQTLESHILLGDSLGLMGTPTLLFEDGSVSTGYSSAIDILNYLESDAELPPASFSWIADFAVSEEEPEVISEPEEPAQKIAIEQVNPQVKLALRNNLSELRLKPVAWQQMQFTASLNFYSTTVGGYRFDVSNDGSFVMKMNLLENRPQLTENQRAKIRKQALQVLDESSAIIFAANSEAQYTVTIFTDANCRFCLSQYRETPYLNQLGVNVRYLAYPSAGLDSLEYKLLNAVWCASDRQAALLAMKLEETHTIPSKNCQSPVAAHYEFAHSLGIQGTPSIVLENGHVLPGYASSDEIWEHLRLSAP